MSGVAGGNRIKKADVERTFSDYYNKVLKQIDGFQRAGLSGSVKAGSKADYGDLDLIVLFRGDDKKEVKKRIIDYVKKLPDNVIVPFKSERYSGKKYYNSGEIITVLFPISGKDDEYIQVDNIIALDETEHTFKTSFLDLPAEKQGLILGLVKTITLEENPKAIFKRLGITDVPKLEEDEEFEFNLSSGKLTLRKVKLKDFKEVGREDVWTSTNWSDIQSLLKRYNLDQDFEKLLKQVSRKLKNPRSRRRIPGIFKSMITVKSGEVGTAKGAAKEKALAQVQSILVEDTKNEVVGLYGGSFKPPHRGHFANAYKLAQNSDRVVIFISPKSREGKIEITPEQSVEIWNIYAKYLPAPLDLNISDVSPITDIYKWTGENQEEVRKVLVGVARGEEKRLQYFEKNKEKFPKVELMYFDLIKEEVSPEDKLSATQIRTDTDYLESMDWAPDQISEEDKKKILDILKSNLEELKMLETMNGTLDSMFQEGEEEIEEGSSGTPIKASSAIPSSVRQKLVHQYNYLKNLIYEPNWNIDFQQDRIVITPKDPNMQFDYTPYMSSILEYMLDKGMKITPLPEIKIRRDLSEAGDFFGKTAYYDPINQEVILYVMARHPKDVMRSFTHEMVHHMQNLQGRLDSYGTTNTNEDSNLNEIEQEAYLIGNTTFRNWEDKVKNVTSK